MYSALLAIPAALLALPAKAVCPVCVVAVGAGLTLSQKLGIDDTVTGVWIGGFTVAMIAWTINWAKGKIKKEGQRKWWNALIFIAFYAMIAWPLSSQGFIGHPLNKIWGFDKIILGIILGSFAFWGASELYLHLKENNGGKAHFPFQKVVMPFSALAILSLFLYILTK